MTNKGGILRPEKIHIVDFKLTKGMVESPGDLDETTIANFGFDVKLDMGFNLEERQIKADLEVTVVAVDKFEKPLNLGGQFHFSFYFLVENLDELVSDTGKSKIVSRNLGNAIASITYSTSRGIMMTRFQGTALRGFILPVVDPNTLLDRKVEK
jgi:hypothetical protein